MSDNREYTAAEIRAILQGPHEYKNGQYVVVVPELAPVHVQPQGDAQVKAKAKESK